MIRYTTLPPVIMIDISYTGSTENKVNKPQKIERMVLGKYQARPIESKTYVQMVRCSEVNNIIKKNC
jgi:hypothetical protein